MDALHRLFDFNSPEVEADTDARVEVDGRQNIEKYKLQRSKYANLKFLPTKSNQRAQYKEAVYRPDAPRQPDAQRWSEIVAAAVKLVPDAVAFERPCDNFDIVYSEWRHTRSSVDLNDLHRCLDSLRGKSGPSCVLDQNGFILHISSDFDALFRLPGAFIGQMLESRSYALLLRALRLHSMSSDAVVLPCKWDTKHCKVPDALGDYHEWALIQKGDLFSFSARYSIASLEFYLYNIMLIQLQTNRRVEALACNSCGPQRRRRRKR
jgi:hypothetical protein